MPQPIQIKRRVTGAAGAPATLLPGELAYNSLGNKLVVGDGTGTVQQLVGSERQVEIAGAQTISGAKTFDAVSKLKVVGGTAGSVLQSADPVTGDLVFGPAVAAAQLFVGSLDAAAGAVTFTTASGGTGPGLPAAAPANSGWYVICDVAGATPPANAPAGNYDQGDWVISNGTAWTHLEFGGISVVTAADVGVAPAVAGGTDVQTVLETLDAEHATFVVGPALSVADRIATYTDATGKLIKDGGKTIAELGDVKGPALSVAGNVATFLDTTGKVVADSGRALPAVFGDVTSPAVSVVDRIAVYSDATGKVIEDGGKTIAELGNVMGPATSAIDNLPVFDNVTGTLLADSGIALNSLLTTVTVAAPELGGTGTAADPITLLAVDGGTF